MRASKMQSGTRAIAASAEALQAQAHAVTSDYADWIDQFNQRMRHDRDGDGDTVYDA